MTLWKIPHSDIDSLEQDIDMDFEENSPHQEGVISDICQGPDKSHFQEPPELQNPVNTGKLSQTCLLKQTDIDKILKIVQRKCKVTFSFYCFDIVIYGILQMTSKTENISLHRQVSLHNMAASSCLMENVYPINFLLNMFIFIIFLLLLLISICVKS